MLDPLTTATRRPSRWSRRAPPPPVVALVILGLGAVASAADSRYLDQQLPFSEPRDRRVDVTTMDLSVRIDPLQRRVSGTVSWTACARSAEPDLVLSLDADDVQIRNVRWLQAPAGTPAASTPAAGAPLRWPLPGAGADRCATLALDFDATPRKGFHFIGDDRDAVGRAPHAWTQGEPLQARQWLPSPDDPDERFTWTLAVDAPAPWRVLSNGDPGGSERKGDRVIARFAMREPHPVYLLSIVAGPFEEVLHRHGRVHIADYALPPDVARARLHGSALPAMLDLFETLTGTPYPHARYGEVWVHEFTSGGMENVTLSTLAHRALGDADSDLDRTPDGLLAHELAHQWFGDLVTCRSWGDLWLNEGFATYYQKLWSRHQHGLDRFYEEIADARAAAIAQEASSPRAVVQDRFEEPGELFNSHSYARGAMVLHMLREALGHAVFDRAIAAYLREHRFASAETVDLRRALERASARSLRGFFRRWLEQPGLPSLTVHARWTHDEGLVVEAAQTQPIDAARPPFDLDLEVLILPVGGAPANRHTLRMRDKRATLTVPVTQVPTPPALVAIDPEGKVFVSVELKSDAGLVLGGLSPGVHPNARLQALSALRGHIDRPAVRDALLQTLASDPARHLRAAAAKALGGGRRDEVRQGLQRALQRDADAHVRAAAAAALGAIFDASATAALQQAARAERSPMVVRAALGALVRIDRKAARSALAAALQRPSFYEQIRGEALQVLATLGEPRDLETIWAATRPGNPKALRASAVLALAQLAVRVDALRDPVRDHLEATLQDSELRLRASAAAALDALSDPASRPALYAAAAREPHEHLRRTLRETAAGLGRALPADERLRKLEAAVERLERMRHEQDGGHGNGEGRPQGPDARGPGAPPTASSAGPASGPGPAVPTPSAGGAPAATPAATAPTRREP